MITISGLKKQFGWQQVLKRVDLTIPDKALFALLGPNGSGKTTLIKIILGIVHPTHFETISVNGIPLSQIQSYKSRIGYMPQWPQFPPHLKVKELISLFRKLRRQESPYEAKIIQDLGIDSFWSKSFNELSGGMTQKVNILQCFMFENPVYILDEPTLGLDPHITFYLKRLMKNHRDQGSTILFTSHIMSEVEELSDQLALLVDGTVYTVTSPEALKKKEGTLTLEQALHHFWDTTRHEKPD